MNTKEDLRILEAKRSSTRYNQIKFQLRHIKGTREFCADITDIICVYTIEMDLEVLLDELQAMRDTREELYSISYKYALLNYDISKNKIGRPFILILEDYIKNVGDLKRDINTAVDYKKLTRYYQGFYNYRKKTRSKVRTMTLKMNKLVLEFIEGIDYPRLDK